MAEIIERLTGRTLDDLAKTYIFFRPLGMNNTMYRAARNNGGRRLRQRKSTTIYGTGWCRAKFTMKTRLPSAEFRAMPEFSARRRILAALFCQMLLDGGVYAPSTNFCDGGTIAQFTTPQQLSGGTRTLGWAVPTEGRFERALFFPRTSFGHTGFTGTSIWIDPDRQLFCGAA